MNNSFAEVDGKPVVGRSRSTSTWASRSTWCKPDGSRTLVVPCIKGADQMDFRQFWQAYEDIVRRARRNELTMDDYAGHHDLADQPGRHRHGPLACRG